MPPQDLARPADFLDRMQFEADPLADNTVAAILGPWQDVHAGTTHAEMLSAHARQWTQLGAINRVFDDWKDNASLSHWTPRPGTPPEVAAAVADYLRQAPGLPAWADPVKIARAEALFMDQGVLSCLLLFCSSLPECYVIPDLSQALFVTGQLEQHTEYRIRATAAMIFPVMMDGGLTRPDGGGIAQVLKVRLIHATIRHLILRGRPEDAAAVVGEQRKQPDVHVLPPLAARPEAKAMHHALFAHGWNVGKDGLPCNQEELAYTLLTFHYVVLRGLRTLGIGLPRPDEEAYLHAWNVMGHVLGVRDDLMAHTMDDAQALFAQMQARGRADPFTPDPRPQLGQALMRSMEKLIPLRLARPIPTLLTRHLCGVETSRNIGIDGHVSWLSKALFMVLMSLVRGIDLVVRCFVRDFSLARLVTRMLGRQVMAGMLMDQTRPLKLPEHVSARAHTVMARWLTAAGARPPARQ
ncbi:MAG TPA: oxygenase MpaB family protein [Albitalea sp.]|uniref:oxygenase MpaB family protein n=1 Tax=Piscinibacter sp. TaxID=1903157 RepID=UPI002ED11645